MFKPPLYCPEKPTNAQKAFLDTQQLEVIFTGPAGGGKSSALLMAALQYVDTPGYNALILGKTRQDLFAPGAIGDRFCRWTKNNNDVKWDDRTRVATYPSGAKIKFGYLDRPEDYKRYAAYEFQFIGIDKTEEIRERDYRYMLSRLRSHSSGPLSLVPLRVRATASFGGGWWEQRFFSVSNNCL